MWPSNTRCLLSTYRRCPGLYQQRWTPDPFSFCQLPEEQRNFCDNYISHVNKVFHLATKTMLERCSVKQTLSWESWCTKRKVKVKSTSKKNRNICLLMRQFPTSLFPTAWPRKKGQEYINTNVGLGSSMSFYKFDLSMARLLVIFMMLTLCSSA